MKKKNKLLRSQKGSISMFVIVSVLFLTFVLIGIYASYANKLKSQDEQLGQLQNNYGEYVSDNGMNNLYNDLTRPPEDNSGNNSLLPAEYQQVEYIKTNSTAEYINTKLIFKSGYNLEMKILPSEANANAFAFGAVESYNTNNNLGCEIGRERIWTRLTAYPIVSDTYLVNVEYLENNVVYYIDKKEIANLNAEYPEREFYIFKANETGKAMWGQANNVLYYCKIWDGETLIRNFIPCYRKSDNVIGMYDIVNGVFYTNQGTGTFGKGEDVIRENITILPARADTTPWLPTGFTKVVGTSLETGLTIANTDDGTPGTQNYVWIEVPTTTEESITLSNGTTKTVKLADASTNEEIALVLEAYAGDYTKGSSTQNYKSWKDEWYDSSGNTVSSSANLEDTEGCGMTYNEYQTEYSNMLRSIKKYGGFWLAQYEAGLSYEQGYRTSHTSITVEKANYAKDQYVYNYVYCNEAQKIANADSTSEHTSSLPFGIQWDLICRFLEQKNKKTYAEMATDSKWGNYRDTLWTSSLKSKYSTDKGNNYITSYLLKENSNPILLTTGAIEKIKTSIDGEDYIANPMNIYDLAGNIAEFTLERSNSSTDKPCSYRGGSSWNYRNQYTMSSRTNCTTITTYYDSGFRSVLYTVENIETEVLPTDYQQVEYIESTGTQYIDTLIKLNQDSKVEMEFEITEAGDYNVFGSRSSASENNIGIIFSNTYKEIDVDFQNYTENRLKTTYDINKKIYKISNESLQAGDSVKEVSNYSSFTTPDNAYIFSMSGNAPTYGNAKMKLYYCKIWDGETLIRNFIPYYRKSDNVIGLYDKVNNVFYINQGTGTFRKGEDVYTEGEDDNNSLIPAAYQQVEYIKSTGTQYIDTGVIPSDEVGCYVDFKPLSAGTIFGAITQSSVGYYGINLYTAKQFEVYWEKSVGKYGSFDYETKYEIEFNYMNSKNFKVDGNQLSALSATDNITTNSIHIFKLNGGTTQYTQYISAKLYRAKISNGENLIRDLVPCYRKSDNVIGMYDIVNGVFYTNQGTGTFEKGEELTELKYLSASGNQYIDTGVKATKNIKMEVVAKQNSLSTDSATGRSGMVLAANKGWYCFGNYGTGNLVVYFCQTTREGVTIPIDTEWHTYYISNGLQKIDDKSSSISVTSEFPTLLNIWLFNLLNNYNISNIADQSIKSAKIWDGDTLIRDYIPVLDKTGVPCLYDKVEEKYYYNKGDGKFLYE